MRFLQRACSAALSLLASLLLFSSILQTDVSADQVQTATVQLTAAQTVALYGQSFPALYYDGSTVSNVTFNFVKSSRTVCDDLNSCFTGWYSGNDYYNVLPNNCYNAFTMYAADETQNLARSVSGFDNQLWSNSSWIGVSDGTIVDREKIQGFEFLMYKASGISPRPVNSSSYDFQFNIQFPFVISGVERFQSLYMLQIGMFTPSDCFKTIPHISNGNLRSEVRLYGENNLVPVDVTTDSRLTFDNTYFGLCYHPINTCNYEASSFTASVPSYSLIDHWLSDFGIFSMSVLDSSVSDQDLSGINWNIRAGDAQACFLKQGFDPLYSDISDPNHVNYQYEDDGIYLMLMCPIIQGDFVIGRPSGSGGDYSAPLNDIIDKLDQIVQNLNIDLDTTNLENTIVSTGNNIVTGIKNLFIPSQSDLINFRLDLEDEFHSFFPAMYTAESKIDSVFRAMEDVSAVDYLMFPGVSVDLPAERGGSANFKINSGAVLLKPAADRIGALYDCLALAIDIIATLAFFNMLRNRFNKFFGEGAEE